MSKLKTLSLFSGIGGIELGLERTNGFETTAFCEIDKHCHLVLQKHWPQVPIHKDVTLLRKEDVGEIDVITGGFPCFPKGTLISTDSGYTEIQDIKVGDKVLTHLGRFRPVTKVFPQPEKALYEIKIQGAPLQYSTEEHPYYVREVSRKWNNDRRSYDRVYSDPKWVEAKELNSKHVVHLPIYNQKEVQSDITVEEAWLMGRYVADGYYMDGLRAGRTNSYNKRVVFCVGKGKEGHFESKLSTYHGCKSKNRTVTKYIVNGDRILGLAKSCGKGAGSKIVPPEILYGSEEIAEAFYEGYMSGDGCFTNGIYKCSSISRNLILQLQYLIARVKKVYANYHLCKRPATCVIEGRTVNQKDSHNLQLKIPRHKQSNYAILDDGLWIPVRQVVKTDLIDRVYNFETEEDHTYLVNNIAVHNCTDVSFAGKQKGFFDEQGNRTRSGLWKEYARLIEELRPKYCIIENVGNLRKNGLAIVVADLTRIGYSCEWHTITATSVGYPHQRERLFIISYPSIERQHERFGEERHVQTNQERTSESVQVNREQCKLKPREIRPILSRGTFDRLASSYPDERTSVSSIRRVVDGIPAGLHERRRKQRIKQLGNAVVPRIAQIIGEAILEHEFKQGNINDIR